MKRLIAYLVDRGERAILGVGIGCALLTVLILALAFLG